MDIKPLSYPEIHKHFPIVFPKDLIDLHVKLKQNLYISFFQFQTKNILGIPFYDF